MVPIVSDIPTTEGGGRAGDHKEKEEERVQREGELHSCIHRLKGSGRVIQKGKFFLMSGATSLGNISQHTFLSRHQPTSAYVCKDLMFLGTFLADFYGFPTLPRSGGRARSSARAMAYDGGGEGEGRKHVKRGSRSKIVVIGCAGNK